MGRHRKLSLEAEEEVRELKRSKIPYKEISAKYGISMSMITNICRSTIVKKEPKPGKLKKQKQLGEVMESNHGITSFLANRVKELHLKECTPAQIEERLGISNSGIFRILKASGYIPHQEEKVASFHKLVTEKCNAYLVKRGATIPTYGREKWIDWEKNRVKTETPT